MMLSLFSPDLLAQYADVKNSVYLLLNKSILKDGSITIPQIESELSSLYIGEYSLSGYNS